MPKIRPKKEAKPDSTPHLYLGRLPSIVGRRRILFRGDPRGGFKYVNDTPEAVAAIKARLGKDFIRDLGVVKNDPRP